MAAAPDSSSSSCSSTDGPVLNLMNKRLRALRKKLNRITQLEESISQGKPIKTEQEDLIRSKPSILTLIDEYDKLRLPLSLALQEELSLYLSNPNPNPNPTPTPAAAPTVDDAAAAASVEDLLRLLYFGTLFDVKEQSDFTSTMLTRTHERGCCITYDYVTDDATDLLGEKDLDLISSLAGLVISRPVDAGVSHKNALTSCVDRAKLWLGRSDKPIQDGVAVTYAGLRQKLEKILASDYFTTTPEMKAPVEVAAAAGKYAPCCVPVQDAPVASAVSEQNEGDFAAHYEHQSGRIEGRGEGMDVNDLNDRVTWDEETEDFEGQGTVVDPTSPSEEVHKDESETPELIEIPIQQEHHNPEIEVEQNYGDAELEQQQYVPKRPYPNQRGGGRGGGGGRRGYSNGRGGRGGRGGGGYQNGRSQYYEQPGNYYPRNYYNTRGRGGGRGGGYNNHGSGPNGGNAQAVESS
ncbi:hypothetical protein Scep_017542 [Stephania cephalantha]|uniref:Glycine-rich protein n=1 Tax=Stephania cephalantha TaxID=152367 RepID=A0AAP0IPS6_9MAGN